MPRWVTGGSNKQHFQLPTDEECDEALLEGIAEEEREKAARLREYETSPEQRDWDHDGMCESEFITEAGMYSPCQCKERDSAE